MDSMAYRWEIISYYNPPTSSTGASSQRTGSMPAVILFTPIMRAPAGRKIFTACNCHKILKCRLALRRAAEPPSSKISLTAERGARRAFPRQPTQGPQQTREFLAADGDFLLPSPGTFGHDADFLVFAEKHDLHRGLRSSVFEMPFNGFVRDGTIQRTSNASSVRWLRSLASCATACGAVTTGLPSALDNETHFYFYPRFPLGRSS